MRLAQKNERILFGLRNGHSFLQLAHKLGDFLVEIDGSPIGVVDAEHKERQRRRLLGQHQAIDAEVRAFATRSEIDEGDVGLGIEDAQRLLHVIFIRTGSGNGVPGAKHAVIGTQVGVSGHHAVADSEK